METERTFCSDTQVDVDREIVKYIREQRHDFMNHIQVIWGYLQLNKADLAKNYISELNKKFSVMGTLFKTENPVLSLFLYNNIRKAYKFGIDIDFDVDAENIKGIFSESSKRIEYLEKIFDEVIKRTLQSERKTIYIDIYEEDRLYMVFSNYSGDDDSCECGDDSFPNEAGQAIYFLREEGAEIGLKVSGSFISISIGFIQGEA